MYMLILCLKHGYWYVVRRAGVACGSPKEGEVEHILDGHYGKYKVIEMECPRCSPQLQLGGGHERSRLGRSVGRV